MDVFQVHRQLLADYKAFTAGFTKIHDSRIREHVDRRMANGDQWPDAYLSLNPNFASGDSISELVRQGFLHRSANGSSVSARRSRPEHGGRLSICTSTSGKQSRSLGAGRAMSHHGNRVGKEPELHSAHCGQRAAGACLGQL